MKNLSPGKILLAEPFMRDPYFTRSVVLLSEHREDGSVGFILNKKIDIPLNDLLASFPEFDEPVYYGGPVQTDTLHYIHNVGDLLEGSVEIGNGVFWGGDYEKLKFLVESELVLPHNIRFFVGYSGWGEGQLEEELGLGSWVMADLDSNYVFNTSSEELWSSVMYNKGDSFQVISQMPNIMPLN